jgi:hypothetical protein
MPTRACPVCGDRYVATATTCADCAVALVDVPDGEGGDEDDEGIAFDLADWDDEQRRSLEAALAAAAIPWEWDGDEVVVDLGDEARVEALIEAVDFPDALAVEADPEEPGDEADPELLSRLFVAADRLRGNPEHPAAVDDVLDAARADPPGPPYGVDGRTWAAVIERLGALAGALDARAEDDVVRDAADALRGSLRPLV